MASTATSDSFECDYLHSHTSRIPHAFTSEQAELTHINEQMRSLDSHISQLNAVRDALHHRSRQLQNLLVPIYALPTEVLSCIFQHVVSSGGYRHLNYRWYHRGLGKALVLSSVSAHFRHVAFGTPELWKGVPLRMTDDESIGQASALLQHCTTCAANVNISIFDTLTEKEARSAIEILLTSDVTRKIKAFELYSSDYASNLWIEKLKGPSFPILDTLDITCNVEDLNLDLGISTVTRVKLYALEPDHPVIMPPSVRYLHLDDVSQKAIIILLYQCPNLEECFADVNTYFADDHDAQFDKPLTLTHLKRLTFIATNIITTASCAQNLRLPSLEYLRFVIYDESKYINVILLCNNVSSTLTTLHIDYVYDTVEYDDLYRLCRLSFPKLRKLGFVSRLFEIMLSAIRALTQRAEECGNVQPHYLPSLTALSLKCNDQMEPHLLLGLLEQWRVGEASNFNLKVKGLQLGPKDWSPGVREQLRSIVGSRQIKVTWGFSTSNQFAFP